MKISLTATILLLGCLASMGQAIPQKRMQEIYEASVTPYKYGMVVAPESNDRKYDCPTVFSQDGRWYMTFVCYDGKDGTDGRGYETWLAESDDLLHWEIKGKILNLPPTPSKGGGGDNTALLQTQESKNKDQNSKIKTQSEKNKDHGLWDQNQRGGFPALIDYEWEGSHEMQAYKGKHWMTYIGGPGTGYEAVNAPLSIGIASSAISAYFGSVSNTALPVYRSQ